MRALERARLTETADGHLTLWVSDASSLSKLRLWALLRFRFGFHRERGRILGAGESIAPDYVRGNVRLLAGAEESLGFYLSSTSTEGDVFLRMLAAKFT
jgi:hypothetical protein